jgi:asparagine synthetase B (glutamine-hydrolysing)
MMQFQHAVTDFVWMDGRLVPPADVAREIEFPASPDPVALARRLRGQFALHQATGSEHVLVRDPLGVNKLFFTIDVRGDVVSSNFWIDLVRDHHSPAAIWSVPSGHLVRVDPTRRWFELTKYAALGYNQDDHAEPDAEDATRIRCALEETFGRLRTAVAGRPLYVTVSGGLDSTTIAALARRHLGEFTAVTFAIHDGEDGPSRPTEDLRYATRVAAELGVPLQVVHATADQLVALIDVALCYGQDWRDFNVHCALVNAALGRAIAAHASHHGQTRPVLLTGDAMNELVADYSPVTYRGRDYYPLPRMPAGQLRKFLVQGLDAGDREIGVFAHYGLDAIQPYTLCADAYTALPGGCLERAEAKQRLVRQVMGDAIPSYVYERPKVRAQIGGAGEVRGTLAALVDRGIDASWLERRFCELFDLELPQLRRAVRAGLYRFPTAYPDPHPSVPHHETSG